MVARAVYGHVGTRDSGRHATCRHCLAESALNPIGSRRRRSFPLRPLRRRRPTDWPQGRRREVFARTIGNEFAREPPLGSDMWALPSQVSGSLRFEEGRMMFGDVSWPQLEGSSPSIPEPCNSSL